MTGETARNDGQASRAFEANVKKPYQRPVLIKMGALRDVTMFKGSGKVSDGSKSKWNNRTGRGGRLGFES
jgi:hypothetical protein